MERITKTPVKATYFKGNFYLRDEKSNWANPIEFPSVFVAYGQAIRSGNWQSCTAINTPQYVIDNYFNGRRGIMKCFWDCVLELENITWDDVNRDKNMVLSLVNKANNELLKMPALE